MLQLENPKYCWAWNRIYVKANGRIPCWCDAGEPYTVVHKSLEENDFVRDIVNSQEMREMRTKIFMKNEYFIQECETCCCMFDVARGAHARFEDSERLELKEKRVSVQKRLQKFKSEGKPDGWINHIKEIQVEPSFPCSLRCPGCLQGNHPDPLSTEPKPYVLPLPWFKRMIDSIVFNNTKLDRIAFVGRGEPTLNKDYPEMITYAKAALPNLVMSMDTNANQSWKEAYGDLTWINCSIDGSNQDSYEKYRVGGKFDKAEQFMREGVASGRTKIRWKYILFDVTQNKDLMNKAQEKAKEIGVAELFFVITHTGGGEIKPSDKFKTINQVQQYIDDNPIFKRTMVTYAT